MELLIAILCGIGIGSVLGYIGAGGSMLAVPALFFIFDFNAVQATTASLLIVFSASLSGVIPKLRSKEVMVKESVVIWAIGLSTNLTGAYFLPQIPERAVLTGFAAVLVVAGISMLVRPPQAQEERKISPVALIAISLLIGAITGLFGIGGGFLAIPILVLFYNIPPIKAAGTSLFIISINTLTGFFAHYRHWDEVSWQIPLLISVVAVLVSRVTSRHSSKLSPSTLKKAFAVFVFLIAFFTLVDTWWLN